MNISLCSLNHTNDNNKKKCAMYVAHNHAQTSRMQNMKDERRNKYADKQ